MTTKILRKSTLVMILALLTSGLGKTTVKPAHPAPILSPASNLADIGGGAPDPCGNGQCAVPAQPAIINSGAMLEDADIGGGAPDPCGNGQCLVAVHLS